MSNTDRGVNPLYQAPGARVLWTNPDPSAPFGAQTIEVPDLDRYEWYYIEVAYACTGGNINHTQGTVMYVPDMDDIHHHHFAVIWYEWNGNYYCTASGQRDVVISRSKCQVTFSNGVFGSGRGDGSTETPNHGIPLKIVGIRL